LSQLLIMTAALPAWAMSAAGRCSGCKHGGPATDKCQQRRTDYTTSNYGVQLLLQAAMRCCLQLTQQQQFRKRAPHAARPFSSGMLAHTWQDAFQLHLCSWPQRRPLPCLAAQTQIDNSQATSRYSYLHSKLLQVHCAIS
jgi:hypothetical protein